LQDYADCNSNSQPSETNELKEIMTRLMQDFPANILQETDVLVAYPEDQPALRLFGRIVALIQTKSQMGPKEFWFAFYVPLALRLTVTCSWSRLWSEILRKKADCLRSILNLSPLQSVPWTDDLALPNGSCSADTTWLWTSCLVMNRTELVDKCEAFISGQLGQRQFCAVKVETRQSPFFPPPPDNLTTTSPPQRVLYSDWTVTLKLSEESFGAEGETGMESPNASLTIIVPSVEKVTFHQHF
jgi:hypothetical protein